MLERSTCIRRNFGAVIVKNDEIISTGYNGAPRGRKNCSDLKYCMREKLNIPRGERYELCRSIHGEQNAIISAARRDLIDSTLYLVGKEVKDDTSIGHTSTYLKVLVNESLERNKFYDITITQAFNDHVIGIVK